MKGAFSVAAAMAAFGLGTVAEANRVESLRILLQIEAPSKSPLPDRIPVTVKIQRDSGLETLDMDLAGRSRSDVPGTEMRSLMLEFRRLDHLDSIRSIDLLTRPGVTGGIRVNPNPTEVKVRQLCVVPSFPSVGGAPVLASSLYYSHDAFRLSPIRPVSAMRDTLGMPDLLTNTGSGTFNQTAALRISLDRADRDGAAVNQVNFRTTFSDTTRVDSSFGLLAETWDGRLFQMNVSPSTNRERNDLVELTRPLGTGDLKAVHGLFARRNVETGAELPMKKITDGGDGVTYSLLATSSAPSATLGTWRRIRQENWTSETHETASTRTSRTKISRSPIKLASKFLVWLETGDLGLDARLTPELEITVKSGKVYRIPFSRENRGGPHFPYASPHDVYPAVLSLAEPVKWADLGVAVSSTRDLIVKDPPVARVNADGIPIHAISKVGISLKWTGDLPRDQVTTEWSVKNLIIAAGARDRFDLRSDDSWAPLFVKMGWNKTFRYVVNSPAFVERLIRLEERVEIAPIAYKVTVSGGVAPRIIR